MRQRNTRSLPDIQQVEADLLTAMCRAACAKGVGVETGEHERAKWAQTKTVGALIDFLRHFARVASETLREAKEIPARMVDSVWLQSYCRRARRSLNDAASAWRVVRIQAVFALEPGDPASSAL
jgi:hypothetical protein